jgi:DNA-directed RNA polymerase subunit K/omega
LEASVIPDPSLMGKFEFVRLSSLRAAQLIRGCTARVPARHKLTTTAQYEIAAGMVSGLPREPVLPKPIR